MKENYLKIGELATLKGVSVKSLRYYDRIGILKPAYVDPQTGYRYYKQEQIILLDIILLCLTFGLPLKMLSDHDREGSMRPDLKNIITDGMEQAKIKMREAEKRLRLSEDLLEQVERIGKISECRFPERTLLVMDWNEKTDSGSTYIKRISEMTYIARESDMTVLTQQGIIKDLKTGRMGVFLAAEGTLKDERARAVTIPEGIYQCRVMREKDTGRIKDIMEKEGISARYTIWLNTDIYDYCLTREERQLEAQFFDELKEIERR